MIEGKRPQIGRQKAERQKHRKGPHIEDALHSPDRNLRGEGEALFLGDDVGANHLAGAAQQSQGGEADKLRRQQAGRGCLADRLQENAPADCAQNICQVRQHQAVESVQPVNVFGAAPERVPVERLPGADLQVNQQAQRDQDYAEDERAFFVHGRKTVRDVATDARG